MRISPWERNWISRWYCESWEVWYFKPTCTSGSAAQTVHNSWGICFAQLHPNPLVSGEGCRAHVPGARRHVTFRISHWRSSKGIQSSLDIQLSFSTGFRGFTDLKGKDPENKVVQNNLSSKLCSLLLPVLYPGHRRNSLATSTGCVQGSLEWEHSCTVVNDRGLHSINFSTQTVTKAVL